jgi:prolyl-tRNA synthetase
LWQEGIETLFDDRLESPGVKFNDADLLGIPVRLVVSPRTLREQEVEVKLRRGRETTLVPMEEVAGRVKELLVT